MKKNKVTELLFPLFLALFSLYIIVEGRTYRGNDRYFPMIIGSLILIVSIWVFIEDLLKKDSVIKLERINFRGLLVATLTLALYIFLFPKIGYIFSTFLLGFCVIKGLGYKSFLGAILWPATLVFVVFVVFKVLLKVPLPTIFI